MCIIFTCYYINNKQMIFENYLDFLTNKFKIGYYKN